ncbi:MAG TPA: 1,4-dihydroxy-2-naphthoate octaprenyltransferase [Bacteroidetes bacterium]|nr:1,4-dihydroxy-2-naphthoate octaprenyltransferase [Bacteroidota bacterium]
MNIKTIFASLRAPFFTAVIVPVILGSVIAWYHGFDFQWGLFFMALVGAVALHAGANTINDYFDHHNRNDELNEEFIRPFTGGSRLIQTGALTPKGMLIISITVYLIGISLGLYLTWLRGMTIFWIGLIGVACGVLYVAPGINLVGRGAGELAIALAFGLCCVNGAYFVQAQTLNLEVVIASLPIAFMITLVLYINEFPDYKADKAVGKIHWVVRLGRKRAATGYTVLMILNYLSILLLAFIFGNLWVLLGLLTIPLALKAARNTLANYDNVTALTPSCAGTIMTHLLTGILLTTGYVLHKLL